MNQMSILIWKNTILSYLFHIFPFFPTNRMQRGDCHGRFIKIKYVEGNCALYRSGCENVYEMGKDVWASGI
jgi:hypothetical protein